jgi:ABC-type multidrug transport system fused ATPase/permease subunit
MSDDVEKQERASGVRTVKRVIPYLWPDGEVWVKRRVLIAMAALLLSKLIAVYTPIIYRDAVNALSEEGVSDLLLGAVGLTVAYGMARIFTSGFQQLRDGVFAAVAQRALRKLALETFTHIHRLSMRYHITRKTGGLSRIIERGVKGVDFLLRFLLFSVGPLVLELLLVAGIFFFLFDVWYLAVVVGTIALYVWFTFTVTEWRVKLRREMNDRDTDANQKAIDSLLNFETVKYFGAERREGQRYDAAMEGYEAAAIKTASSLAFLNFGQALLITMGLIAVMVMAALGIQNGDLTVGDFVLVNAYMIQITLPLNFLGTVYREIRQSLVDMGEMFDLLGQPAEIEDKPGATQIKVSNGIVVLENVHFGYDAARPILKGVSLKVGCDCGAVGLGQVNHRTPAVPLLRRLRRSPINRWAGCARCNAREFARGDWSGSARHRAVK